MFLQRFWRTERQHLQSAAWPPWPIIRRGKTYVTRHYYAVDQDEICDTFLRLPLEIHRFKRGRARWVKRLWQFAKEE